MRQRSDIHLTLSSQDSSQNISPDMDAQGSHMQVRQITRAGIEKAVKRLEFGRVSNRSNLYLRDALMSPTRKDN